MRFTVGPFFPWLALAATLTTTACSALRQTSSGSSGQGSGETLAQAAGARRENGSPPVPVVTATVDRKSMPMAIRVIGAAEAYSNVAVHPQITGQLTSVDFEEGGDVTKGEIIFTLDFRPLEAALEQANANLTRDAAQAANARASSARYQDLQSRGIATKEQADQSRTSADALDATVQADRAAVDNAKVQLQYATIMAPISGRTGALMVHEGNLVRANDATPLVVINQISPIYVSFGIPEGELPDLKRYLAQRSVTVEAAPPGEAETSRGRITFIDNAVDATTGQIKIKASFPNEDRRLWPGQFVNVTVTLKVEADAIVVPTAAVQNGQEGSYVFVLKPDRTVELRSITIEREAAESTIVQTGLTQGEIVVTDGQLRLASGSKVSVKSGPGGPGGPGGLDARSARSAP
jgi:multidrug efflux system membrane fusion protein